MIKKISEYVENLSYKYHKYKIKRIFKKQEKEYKKLYKKSLKQSNVDDLDLLSDGQLNEQKELDERNHLYSSLLKSYVLEYSINQNKKNRKKWQFYYIVVIAFVLFLLLLVAMSVVITIYFNEEKDAVLISYFTSFIGIFSTLAVMPHTIVKYLFNPKEDEIISKLVTDMQAHDNRTKEINMSREKKSNEQKATKDGGEGDAGGNAGNQPIDNAGNQPTDNAGNQPTDNAGS